MILLAVFAQGIFKGVKTKNLELFSVQLCKYYAKLKVGFDWKILVHPRGYVHFNLIQKCSYSSPAALTLNQIEENLTLKFISQKRRDN